MGTLDGKQLGRYDVVFVGATVGLQVGVKDDGLLAGIGYAEG